MDYFKASIKYETNVREPNAHQSGLLISCCCRYAFFALSIEPMRGVFHVCTHSLDSYRRHFGLIAELKVDFFGLRGMDKTQTPSSQKLKVDRLYFE